MVKAAIRYTALLASITYWERMVTFGLVLPAWLTGCRFAIAAI